MARGVERAVRPQAAATREVQRPGATPAPGADASRSWPAGPPTPPTAPVAQQSQRMPEIKIQLSGLPAGMSATTMTRAPDGGGRVEGALQGIG